MNTHSSKYPTPYIKSLSISGLKCFKKETSFDFTGPDGEPSRWTIILGDNNTGKTTILKAIAGLESELTSEVLNPQYSPKKIEVSNRDFTKDQINVNINTTFDFHMWFYTLILKNPGMIVAQSNDPNFRNFKIHGKKIFYIRET